MIAKEEIEQIKSRLEKLEGEKADIAQNITDTLAEAKVKGYDVKILKQLLKLRKRLRSNILLVIDDCENDFC